MNTAAAYTHAPHISRGEFLDTLNILGREFTVEVRYEYDRRALRDDAEPIELVEVELLSSEGINLPAGLVIDASEITGRDYDRLMFAAHCAEMRS